VCVCRRATEAASSFTGPNLKWRFVVINDAEVNAFCTPGGLIVVNTGLLDFLYKYEAEFASEGVEVKDALAAVLCHEIGHAVARHSSEKIAWVPFFSFVALLQRSSPLLVSMIDLGLKLPMSRGMEREADWIGMELMARACFNIHAASILHKEFERFLLSENADDVIGEYFSTHPRSAERAKFCTLMEEQLKPQWLEACNRS